MELYFRKCTMSDLASLRDISIKTYSDAFRKLNTSSNMELYLEKAYSAVKLREELADKNSAFLFLYADSELTGYIKLNEMKAQTDIHDIRSL